MTATNDKEQALFALARIRSVEPAEPLSHASVSRAVVEYVAAVDAAEQEHERAQAPGACAASSAPVVRVITTFARLRQAIEAQLAAMPPAAGRNGRTCVTCPACGTGVLHPLPSGADVLRIEAIAALAAEINGTLRDDDARAAAESAMRAWRARRAKRAKG